VLERLCAPLIDQSLEVCAVALDRAGLEPTDVTQLVVTGGVSRMPFVRDALSRYFQREVTQLVNPDEAIALGAGLKAAQAVGHLVHGVARRGG
jgi:molecular chaperone DnaK (HSP70)